MISKRCILLIFFIGQQFVCPIKNYASSDTTEINRINKYANSLLYEEYLTKTDSIKNLAIQNIQRCKNLKYKKGEAEAKLILAKCYVFGEINNVKALALLIETKNIFQTLSDTTRIADCNLQIGVVTYSEKLYDQSIEANRQAFLFYQQKKQFKKAVTAKYLIALSYIEIKKYEEAKLELDELFSENRKTKDINMDMQLKLALANLNYNTNNFTISKNLYFQTLQKSLNKDNFIPNKPNLSGIILSKIGLGKTYLALNQLDSAEYYLLDAYKISATSNRYLSIIEASKYLSWLYKQKKDYQKLAFYQEIFFTKQDSTSNHQTTNAISELLNQVVINDKQSEINSLSTKEKIYQIWMLVLGIVILLGSLVIYLFYKSSKTKQRLNEKLTATNDELKQSQEKILNLQKYKEHFLANITHELRTPLNAIKGISDLLSFSNSEEERKELVSGLKKSSNHLLNMVNDFLDFSKLKEGKLILRRQPFQLQNVIKSAVNFLKVNAEEKQLEYTLALSQMPETVMGDESRLIQILVNIIGNSIKFTSTGFVKVVCKGKLLNENKCEIEIRISDSGIGISTEKIKSIFEDYEQADENISATFGGTGLGLGICKRLIEQHQGTITCESELGKGSTFIIKLPYEYLKIEEIEIKDLQNFDSLAAQKINIIIADDNEMNLLVAEKLIEKNMPFAKLLKAENGKQVIDLLIKNKVDLILMDMKMPVMDGIEATKIIRADKSIIQPHIIAMTAGTSEDEIAACYESGMNDYLPKPYHIEVLLSKIQKVAELISTN